MATTNLEFTKLNASLQVGDYVFSSSTQTNGAYSVQGVSSFINGDIQLGRVKSITTPTSTSGYVIEVQLDNATILPSASDYFYFVKDSRVNKSGLKGYYAEIKFENTDKAKKSELFAISTEITESSK
tara:strand:- start:442 stop:822 length:381 start_codon:yes stop_codon:yes gene_type:complete